MDWDLAETISYYQKQGAPGDQSAVISLLREVQQRSGGQIPATALPQIADALNVKDSFLRALIRRIPSLHLKDAHCLELCGGHNCGRQADLTAFLEKTYGAKPEKFTVKYVPCMRNCGKGPNIRWDGTLYHRADESLLRSLLDNL